MCFMYQLWWVKKIFFVVVFLGWHVLLLLLFLITLLFYFSITLCHFLYLLQFIIFAYVIYVGIFLLLRFQFKYHKQQVYPTKQYYNSCIGKFNLKKQIERSFEKNFKMKFLTFLLHDTIKKGGGRKEVCEINKFCEIPETHQCVQTHIPDFI